jgi:RHS repeat-associated protein
MRDRRPLFSLLFLVITLLLSTARTARAQVGVNFSPASGSWTVGTPVYVTIEFCSNPEQWYLSHWITFNGQDVSGTFSQGSGYDAACTMQIYFTGTVTLESGTNTLAAGFTAYYFDGADVYYQTNFSDTTTYDGTSPPAPTVVASVGAVVQPANGIKGTFRVTANYAGTHALNVSCSGSASSCSVSPSSVSLSIDESADAEVTYNVSGSPLAIGQVTLTATNNTNAQASFDVRVAPAGPVIAREQCLTIAAAGPAAAYECGDLRVVHALPAVQTMGKTRAPVLMYNSQHGQPYPLFHADLTLSANDRPDSVIATLKIGGVTRDRRAWAGGQWTPSNQSIARRLVAGFYADTFSTGFYSYEFEISRVSGGSYSSIRTDTGTVTIVNRINSPFGRGWWLAGFEQLLTAGTSRIWVGGDGSVRRYDSVGTGGSKKYYLATPVDSPDSLIYDSGTQEYTRVLNDGGSVAFNSAGFHVRTINSQGHVTKFIPNGGNTQLDSIALPPDSARLGYRFIYGGGSGTLSEVRLPDTSSGSYRSTSVTTSGNRITAITDPGASAVEFGYTSVAGWIGGRWDRRGNVTYFSYNEGHLYRSFEVLSGTDTIAHRYAPGDNRGIQYANLTLPHPDSTWTVFDGPRGDVADTTMFLEGPFGSVKTIRDVQGNVTTITRGDARWPALATRVLSPNGRIVGAAYDGRGNVARSTDSSVVISGVYATTRYEWHPATSAITNMVPPELDSTVFSYDGNGRNRLWQQDASGSSSRVNFGYNGFNQVVTMLAAGASVPDSVFYSDTTGNVIRTRSPIGFKTLYDRNRLGLITRVRTPLDSAQSTWREERTYYDAMLRDTLVESRASGDTLRVRKWFNAESQVDSLRRWSNPDPTSTGTITTRWLYDVAGRPYRETAPDGQYETRTFDLAGNVTRLLSRRGDTTDMQYDVFGRLSQRITRAVTYDSVGLGIAAATLTGWRRPYPWYPTDTTTWRLTIPGDTATFSHDAMGNMLTARNHSARITRQYTKDGLDSTQTQVLLPWTGSDSTLHSYTISHVYDLNRRLRVVRHPAQLAPSGSAGRDTVRYAYNTRGMLSDVYDLQGNRFEYQYDVRGRRTAIDLSTAGITQNWSYDADDRLLMERVSNSRHDTTQSGSKHHLWLDSLRRRSFRYADPGRVWQAFNGKGWFDSSTATYTGLGQLARLIYKVPVLFLGGGTGVSTSDEQFASDALGNTMAATTTSTINARYYYQSQSGAPRYSRYYANTGRLRATSQAIGGYTRTDSLLYDAAGNNTITWTSGYGPSTVREDRVSFYGGDGMLHAAESRSATGNQTEAPWTMVFEEFRYDALGRRVAVRTRRKCEGGNDTGCSDFFSTLRRTVWDGSQELWEIQAPGTDDHTNKWEVDTARVDIEPYSSQKLAGADFNRQYGRIGYTHGPGIDQPLSGTRLALTDWAWSIAANNYVKANWAPFTVVPLWNWRGHPEIIVFADTGSNNDGNWRYCTGTTELRCVPTRSRPAATAQSANPSSSSPWYYFAWVGGLTDQKEDGTGTFYRRNRYIDPSSGRFTQEDPIGLAGGLNLYGFASGDPVNLSDPFGLCPWCIGAAVGAALGAGGTLVYNYLNDQPLTTNLVRNTLVGGAAGATLGLGYTAVAARGGAAAIATAAAAAPAAVSSADAVARGLVSAGGRLVPALQAIEAQFAAATPSSAQQALGAVALAVRTVGLEPGKLTQLANGAMQLQNVGGIVTTLQTNGGIVVQRGADVLLRLVP